MNENTNASTDAHWHVQIHGEDQNIFTGTVIECMDYASEELKLAAEQADELISVFGGTEHYRDAYRSYERANVYAILAANAANVVKQATVPHDERAPLFRASDTDHATGIDLYARHMAETINADGPIDFAVWECFAQPCEIAESIDDRL